MQSVESAHLATRIRQELERITKAWERRVWQETQSGRKVGEPILRDSMSFFLQRLADAFDPNDKSGLKSIPEIAKDHGEKRAAHDFNLNELLLEYVLLRQILFEILEEERPLSQSERDGLLDVLQSSTRNAVDQFAKYQRARLEVQTRMFDTVLSNQSGLIYMFDSSLRLMYANKPLLDLLGLTLEQAVGRNLKELGYPPDLVELHNSQLTEVLRSKCSVKGKNFFVNAKGSKRYYEYNFFPILNATGAVEAITGTSRDETDRKAVEDLRNEILKKEKEARTEAEENVSRLRAERELRERFVFTLTHDLRTPLTAAKANAQILQRKHHEAEVVRKHANRIVFNIDRADHMIRDLLDVNLIRAGEKIPLDIREVDLSQLARKALEELVSIYGQRFQLEAPMELRGYWDEQGLWRIIENLASNAVKYGDPQSPITIQLGQGEDRAWFDVHNHGNPIPKREIGTLFEPFRRADTARESRQKGWGLGLALVRGIAEALGGKVGVTSDSNAGTRFRVELPKDSRIRQINVA